MLHVNLVLKDDRKILNIGLGERAGESIEQNSLESGSRGSVNMM